MPSLSGKILAFLGESPLPVPTADLIAALAHPGPNARQVVCATLARLRAGGLVRGRLRRWPDARGREQRVAFWELAGQGAGLAERHGRVE